MSKTIIKLWNGTLDPIRYLGKNNAEMRQLEDLIQRNLNELEENLNKNEKKLFEKYYDCINEYIIVISEQAFYDGFCRGTKIVAEALNEPEPIM